MNYKPPCPFGRWSDGPGDLSQGYRKYFFIGSRLMRIFSLATLAAPLASLALFFAPGTAISQQSAPSVDDLKNSCRQALGYANLPGDGPAIALEGTATLMPPRPSGTPQAAVEGSVGVQRPVRFLFSSGGEWALRTQGEFLPSAGFDGSRYWIMDHDRNVIFDDHANNDAYAMAASVLSLGWLSPAASPVEVTGIEFERGRGLIRVGLVTRNGKSRGVMTLDSSTYYPTRLNVIVAGDEQIWTYDDYRTFEGGLTLPAQYTYSDRVENKYVTTFAAIHTVEPDFAPPVLSAGRVSFDTSVEPLVTLRRVERKPQFFVNAEINGKVIGPFIFGPSWDANLISPTAAAEAGLTTEGLFSYRTGGGPGPARFRKAQTLKVGPMTISDAVFIQADFAFENREMPQDHHIAGVLGHSLLAHAAVEFDPQNLTLTINDPSTYQLPSGVEWEPLELNYRRPQIPATFEGDHKGWFNVEPSISSGLEFNGPTVREFNLLGTRQHKMAVRGSAGAMRQVAVGDLTFFQLGSKRYEGLSTAFFEGANGWAGDPYASGTIGLEILKDFRIVLDYSNRRCAILPR